MSDGDDRTASLSKGRGASLKYVRLRLNASTQTLIKERGPPGNASNAH
jgi:hypothetical protein